MGYWVFHCLENAAIPTESIKLFDNVKTDSHSYSRVILLDDTCKTGTILGSLSTSYIFLRLNIKFSNVII
jgi:hypothetical protein